MAAAPDNPRPVALVTGASRGIGRAIATQLDAAGYALGLCARSSAELAALAAELQNEALVLAADLRDPAVPDQLIARLTRELGPPSVLCNNAGTAPTGRFEDTGEDTLEQVLDLHLRAPFRLIQAALPTLREAPRACVVQLASTAGLRGFPYTSAYTAGKHAMVGLTRALHSEWQRGGPRIYALCPGFVDTDITRQAAASIAARGKQSTAEAMQAMGAMNRIGRMHSCEEVADAALHLIRTQPEGCVYDLDQEPPSFV